MAERSGYVSQPFVRDPRTMLDLMRLASADRSRSMLQRADARAQGIATIGQLIASALGGIRQEREQQAAAALKADQEAADRRQRQNEMGLREMAMQADAMQSERQAKRPFDIGGRLVDPSGDVLYEPPAEPEKPVNVGDRLVLPSSGEVRYEPPAETKPEPNPTEASLAMMAARGDKMAAQALATLRGMRQSATSGPRPLTQTAEAQIIQRLANQWGAANKPLKELDRQVALMDSGMEAVKRGDRAQGDQVVLVTFQKILDPPSVVRESEFMRSSAGQALMARVQGAYERLVSGGAGMKAEELQKFADLAREAAAAQRKAAGLDATRSRLGRTAQRYNIPEELIFDMPEQPASGGDTGEAVEEWISDGKGGFKPKGRS